MVFSSELFLFLFFPITLIVYYLVDARFKNICLFLASLSFYAWGEPVHVFLMLAAIGVNYVLGLLIEKFRFRPFRKRLLLIIAILWDIGMLGFFKYANFIVCNLNLLGFSIETSEIMLPIGISFYTFQIMSYVIDVYRGTVPAQRSVLNLGLYISLFPQLIAGPIVRYSDVLNELSARTVTAEDMYSGIKRFMFGFSKKILIADQVSKIADAAFAQAKPSMNLAWLGIIAYTIQIYFDFSGYSDMAIGLGRLFGFHFLENFDYPYMSTSVREFWRRWHISLGNWFRDYVYIPMGGSRTSSCRTCFNLLTVFFLTGFWHGAGWNFIAWGLWYGVFMILERITGNRFNRIPIVIRRIYTLLVVIIGWVFFRADGLRNSLSYLSAMFSFRFEAITAYEMTRESITVFLSGIIFSTPVFQLWKQNARCRNFCFSSRTHAPMQKSTHFCIALFLALPT